VSVCACECHHHDADQEPRRVAGCRELCLDILSIAGLRANKMTWHMAIQNEQTH
jgi:hypothetical protein